MDEIASDEWVLINDMDKVASNITDDVASYITIADDTDEVASDITDEVASDITDEEASDITDNEASEITNEVASNITIANGPKTENKLECAICLQPSTQPVQLPCCHIFCYLCVKGVSQQSKKCAICRQEIPLNYLDNPQLIAVEKLTVAFEGSYQWFYEGRNGWWQYDDRTSLEIEAAYQKGKTQCEMLIAGFLYIIDFQNNFQSRRCDPKRRRRIKRDLVTIPKKGIAGIRMNTGNDISSSSSDNDSTTTNALLIVFH